MYRKLLFGLAGAAAMLAADLSFAQNPSKDAAMKDKASLRIINIAALFDSKQEESIADIRMLQKDCGITDVAFMMPLCPNEKAPSMSRAESFRDKFIKMRSLLEGSGLRVGILIQSTLGHGGSNSSPFTHSVNAKGDTTGSLCPFDPGLREHLRKAVAIVAATKPDFFILDDDFRLANWSAPGCFCPLHLAAFEKASGQSLDREALLKAIEAKTPEGEKLKSQWENVRRESLAGLAKAMRTSIDETNPNAEAGFCVCDAGGMELQFAKDIESAIAGKGPQWVRINNACYLVQDPRSILSRLYWTGAQMDRLRDMPEILGESDSCPQNRFSTPARILDAQIVFSIMSGCTGLKLWISKLDSFAPEAGAAYRSVMKKRIGAYQALRSLTAGMKSRVPSVPLPSDTSSIPAAGNPIRDGNWATAALGHLGIPCRVGFNDLSSAFMLTGPETALFSDDEIKGFLSKSLLLDGSAALALSKRGFSEFMGVEASKPEGWRGGHDKFNDDPLNGGSKGSGSGSGNAPKLTPLPGAKVRELASMGGKDSSSPSVTLFENSLGGRVAIVASTLESSGFFTPIVNINRRDQLFGIMDWLNKSPVPAVSADLSVFAMHGEIDPANGGGELLAVFVLSVDPLDSLKLHWSGSLPKSIEKLNDDGSFSAVSWKPLADGSIVVDAGVENVCPAIFRIKR